MSKPKFKIGETVVITEVDSLVHSDYIGKVVRVWGHYKGRFAEDKCDYQVKLYKGKNTVWCYANVREATEMDKVLEGL
jgi:hypothetical protein